MPKTDKTFMLFDGRYRTDKDSAICYDTCDTLKDAIKEAPDYGDDTVIVECEIIDNVIKNTKIINNLKFH